MNLKTLIILTLSISSFTSHLIAIPPPKKPSTNSVPAKVETPAPKKSTASLVFDKDGTLVVKESSTPGVEIGKSIFDGKRWIDGNKIYSISYFKASDGIRIPYLAIIPTKPISRTLPAIISYPGSEPGSVLHADYLSRLAENGRAMIFSIGSRGVAPLPIDNKLHGNSEVISRDLRKILQDSLDFRDFIESQKSSLKGRISVCGVSQGGYVALDVANKRETDACFVIAGLFSDWKVFTTSQFLAAAKAWTTLVDLNKDGELNQQEYFNAKTMKVVTESHEDEVPKEVTDQLKGKNLMGVDIMMSTWIPPNDNISIDSLLEKLKNESNALYDRAVEGKEKETIYNQYVKLLPGHELILTTDTPTFVFHGALDSFASIEGVDKAKESLESLGMNHAQIKVFKDRNHFLTKGDRSDAEILAKKECKPEPTLDEIIDDIENYFKAQENSPDKQ